MRSKPKPLGLPHASPATLMTEKPDGRAVRQTSGLVAVWASMDWTQSDQLASALLTPAQARHLALELLQVAEQAEGNGAPL